ncbi:hypothetical protein CERSUDRAFT_110862 [Gelatoporia subvermispora B]|uniref:Uncharacterized protein n=1 Tax=Ceriporiopsis subvermispora (strain B) TaxID=914234 RepID=M2QYW3_CERS8|nr:hypothetical protein CERSUDRAFT_110862 [Gelatoporia subvermispora B]
MQCAVLPLFSKRDPVYRLIAHNFILHLTSEIRMRLRWDWSRRGMPFMSVLVAEGSAH